MKFPQKPISGLLRRATLLVAVLLLLPGCANLVVTATSGMAENLNLAMMNQNDPDIVRDGAPAYLLMLDSFVEGAPENVSMLSAAAELYAGYGVVFVDDPDRAKTLTTRARSYGKRALCSQNNEVCGIDERPFDEFEAGLQKLNGKDAPALYSFTISWLAWIKANSSDWSAMADLPKVELSLKRMQKLALSYQRANVEHMLAVLNTIRPPALGGNFDAGLAHYKRAMELSNNRDLSIQVDFAQYYARTLFDRELHDRLLNEVLDADPNQPGLTLFNTIAKRQARDLLVSADDYF
jgi:ribosomal protein S7